MEFNDRRTREVDLTVNGRSVSTRKMPLRVAMRLYSHVGEDGKADVPVEDMAAIVMACLVYTDTKERVFSDDDLDLVLDADADFMTAAFQAIADFSSDSMKDAEKN